MLNTIKKRKASVTTEVLMLISYLSEKIIKNTAIASEYHEYENAIVGTGAYSKEEIHKLLFHHGFESYSELIKFRSDTPLLERKELESTCIVPLTAIGLSLIFGTKNMADTRRNFDDLWEKYSQNIGQDFKEFEGKVVMTKENYKKFVDELIQ